MLEEEVQIQCPHCGQILTSRIDTSAGSYTTIEDCQVCCRPMLIHVTCIPGEVSLVEVSAA